MKLFNIFFWIYMVVGLFMTILLAFFIESENEFFVYSLIVVGLIILRVVRYFLNIKKEGKEERAKFN